MSVRSLLIAFSLCCFAGAAFAQAPAIIVNKDSASPQTFELSKLVRVNFVDGGLEFVVDGEDDAPTMSFADIATVHFGETMAIGDAINPASDFLAFVDESRNTLRLVGLDESCAVVVFSVNGQCVVRAAASPDGVVDISSLLPGMYIVKNGANTQKFVK